MRLSEDTFVDLVLIVPEGGIIRYFANKTGFAWLARKGQTEEEILLEIVEEEKDNFFLDHPDFCGTWILNPKECSLQIINPNGISQYDIYLEHFGYQEPLWRVLQRQENNGTENK